MIDQLIHVLAQADPPEGGPPGVAIVFVIIWAIVIAVNAYQKWQQKQRDQAETQQQIDEETRAETRGRGPEPVAQPQRRPPPQPVRQRQPARRPPPAPPPRPVIVAQPIVLEPVVQSASSARTARAMDMDLSAPAPKGVDDRPSVTGEDIRRLLQPETLRQSIALMEVLQPPVAMRQQPPGLS
jgi:type IV secretory pathway VirB10-like protein